MKLVMRLYQGRLSWICIKLTGFMERDLSAKLVDFLLVLPENLESGDKSRGKSTCEIRVSWLEFKRSQEREKILVSKAKMSHGYHDQDRNSLHASISLHPLTWRA